MDWLSKEKEIAKTPFAQLAHIVLEDWKQICSLQQWLRLSLLSGVKNTPTYYSLLLVLIELAYLV